MPLHPTKVHLEMLLNDILQDTGSNVFISSRKMYGELFSHATTASFRFFSHSLFISHPASTQQVYSRAHMKFTTLA
jgi:hypothetical protein